MAAPRKRRRRRIGAAIAIALAFAIGIAVTWGADSIFWGALAGLGAGGFSWGVSLFGPGAEVTLTELGDGHRSDHDHDDDDDEGLSADSGFGDV